MPNNMPIIAGSSVRQHCYKTSLHACCMLATTSFFAALTVNFRKAWALVISTSPPPFLSSVHSTQTFHFNHFTNHSSSRVINNPHLPRQWSVSSPGSSSWLDGMLWVTLSLFRHFLLWASGRPHSLGSPPTWMGHVAVFFTPLSSPTRPLFMGF